jgi:hypothetical protein
MFRDCVLYLSVKREFICKRVWIEDFFHSCSFPRMSDLIGSCDWTCSASGFFVLCLLCFGFVILRGSFFSFGTLSCALFMSYEGCG